jgi:hypothetical protein
MHLNNLGKQRTAFDSNTNVNHNQRDPWPIFLRHQTKFEKMKPKPNLDHHDPSKGKPKVRTKPVSGLAIGQVKGEGSKGFSGIHGAGSNSSLQIRSP